MRRNSIQIIVILLAVCATSQQTVAQEGDFSLGDEPINDGGTSAPIDNFDGKSDLFGDMPVNTPQADTKSTIVPAPLSNKLVPMSDPSIITKPAASSLPQPPVETSSSGVQPPAAVLPANESAAQKSAAGEVATLEGDGSLAPIKTEQKIKANDFGGVPPMPGTRREMAPGEAPEFYGVEEGDTMFDVCSQLIDDGNYWPKLWSLNPDVKNPHFIYPGMKLAFYSGDEENPPYLEVVTEDEVVPIEKGPLKEAELVSQVVAEAGSPGGSESTINVLAAEAPTAVIGPGEIGADSDGLDGFIFAGKVYSGKTISFIVPAFYFDDERTPLGQVLGGSFGENIRGDDTRVVIEPTEGLALGTYTILRPQGPAISRQSGSKIGYRYDFAGNVRITKQNRSGLMEGIVFGGRNGVAAGDIVVSFIATRRSLPDQMVVGPLNNANSSVLGFTEAGKTAGGLGDLVFLEKEGLSVGASYAIYRKEDSRDIRHVLNKELASDGFGAGVVKVLEVNGQSAMGYIVSANSEVRVGDTLSP